MNKRQWKKANKKADMWVGLDTIIIDKKGELMFNKNTKKIEINGERETKYFVAGEGYVSKAE